MGESQFDNTNQLFNRVTSENYFKESSEALKYVRPLLQLSPVIDESLSIGEFEPVEGQFNLRNLDENDTLYLKGNSAAYYTLQRDKVNTQYIKLWRDRRSKDSRPTTGYTLPIDCLISRTRDGKDYYRGVLNRQFITDMPYFYYPEDLTTQADPEFDRARNDLVVKAREIGIDPMKVDIAIPSFGPDNSWMFQGSIFLRKY